MSVDDTTRRMRLCARCAFYVERGRWEVDPPDAVGGGACEACGSDDMTLTQEVWMDKAEAARIGLASKTSPSSGNSYELNFRCPTCGAYPALCCLEPLKDGSFPKEPFVLGIRTLGFASWHDARVDMAKKDREENAKKRAAT